MTHNKCSQFRFLSLSKWSRPGSHTLPTTLLKVYLLMCNPRLRTLTFMGSVLRKRSRGFTPFVKETFKKVISFGSDLSRIWDE